VTRFTPPYSAFGSWNRRSLSGASNGVHVPKVHVGVRARHVWVDTHVCRCDRRERWSRWLRHGRFRLVVRSSLSVRASLSLSPLLSDVSLALASRRAGALTLWYACIRTRKSGRVYVACARVPVCTRGYKACHVPAGVLPPGVRSSGPNQPASPNQLQPAGPTTIEITRALSRFLAPSLSNSLSFFPSRDSGLGSLDSRFFLLIWVSR